MHDDLGGQCMTFRARAHDVNKDHRAPFPLDDKEQVDNRDQVHPPPALGTKCTLHLSYWQQSVKAYEALAAVK